jgi:GT2 family glycosyltransferase
MTPEVDVIVLSWNRIDVTRSFIESFCAHTSISVRLIIIDNASTDGTQNYLETLVSTDTCLIEVVCNAENRGFVDGMNQGIGMTTAPYVCLANNDLVFTDGWLSELIDAFDLNPEFGLLNPNSNNLGTKPKNFDDINLLASELKSNGRGSIIEVPFCIGFCMVIRRKVIDAVGGLSPEFRPMFFEDTDYSLKVQNAGYRIGMAERSYVWHSEHASFGPNRSIIETYFSESKKKFHKKWGKVLRVAIDVNSYGGLTKDIISSSIEMARGGNFIFLFYSGLHVNRKNIFAQYGFYEHSGVSLLRFPFSIWKYFKILTKKKKYDVIFSSSFLLKLGKFRGSNVCFGFDAKTINAFKMTY